MSAPPKNQILCINCNQPTPEHHNYCNWECHIEYAKKMGGKVHCPNGLPIGSIMANGDMFEISHGNHPDYKFPVEVEFVGVKPLLPDWDDSYGNQTHALIYTDKFIAITLYECCYAMWYVRSGKYGGGSLWDKEWKLNDASIKKILNQE